MARAPLRPRRLVALAALPLAAACGRGTPDADAAPAGGVAARPAWFAPAPTTASAAAHARYTQDLDTLLAATDALLRAAERPATARDWGDSLRVRFVAARDAYKRVEAMFEFQAPTTASEINGPALPEVEEEEGTVVPVAPDGFQVVEELVWGGADPADSLRVRNEAEVIRALVVRARAYAKANSINEPNLFDAVRQEIARVSVLALADFDSPVARRGLVEGAIALSALDTLASPFASRAEATAPRQWGEWRTRLADAVTALRAVRDVDAADRAELTRAHLVPLAHAWDRVRTALGIPLPPDPRPWRAQAASVFDRGAFDAWQFAPAWAREGDTPAAVTLGRALFSDARLSGDGTRSCASCHVPERAFTESRARSAALGGGDLARNAPTLLNAALSRAQFADARAAFLEDQVTDVVENAHELGGRLESVAATFRRDPAVRALFRAAFGERGDSTVTPMRIRIALGAYERALVALDSPFDRYVRGDGTAMDADARRGYDVFMGKGRCGTCHFAPLFNGTVPPDYRKSELEVLGTPATRGWRGVRLDGDRGRAARYATPIYERAFKTPTVRNAALTAPYMHNGVYATLEEVTEFYARGGGAGLGLDVPNQTLPGDRIHLTEADRRALHAFIRALTDTAGTTRRR